MRIIHVYRISDVISDDELIKILDLEKPVAIIDGFEIMSANIPWINSMKAPPTWEKLVKGLERIAEKKNLGFIRPARLAEKVVKYTDYLLNKMKPKTIVLRNMCLPLSMFERDLLVYWIGLAIADSGADTLVIVSLPNTMYFTLKAALEKKKRNKTRWSYIEIDNGKAITVRREWNLLSLKLTGITWDKNICLIQDAENK